MLTYTSAFSWNKLLRTRRRDTRTLREWRSKLRVMSRHTTSFPEPRSSTVRLMNDHLNCGSCQSSLWMCGSFSLVYGLVRLEIGLDEQSWDWRMNYFRLLSCIEHHVSLRRGRYISPRIVSEFYFVLSIMCRRGGEEYMQMCISPPIISNFYFVWSLRREEYMQQPAPHCQDRFTLHTLAISLPFIWTLGRSNNWAFSMNALILLLQSFSLLLIILGPIRIPDTTILVRP